MPISAIGNIIGSMIRTLVPIAWDIIKIAGPPILKYSAIVAIGGILLTIIGSISGFGGFIIVLIAIYSYAKAIIFYDPAKYGTAVAAVA